MFCAGEDGRDSCEVIVSQSVRLWFSGSMIGCAFGTATKERRTCENSGREMKSSFVVFGEERNYMYKRLGERGEGNRLYKKLEGRACKRLGERGEEKRLFNKLEGTRLGGRACKRLGETREEGRLIKDYEELEGEN